MSEGSSGGAGGEGGGELIGCDGGVKSDGGVSGLLRLMTKLTAEVGTKLTTRLTKDALRIVAHGECIAAKHELLQQQRTRLSVAVW